MDSDADAPEEVDSDADTIPYGDTPEEEDIFSRKPRMPRCETP